MNDLVIVSQTWPRGDVGGTEWQAAALAARLAARGARVRVWTRRNSDPLIPIGTRLEQFSRSSVIFALQVAARARTEAPPVLFATLVSSHSWALSLFLRPTTRFYVKIGCAGLHGDVETSLARPWGRMKLRHVFARADGIVVPEPSIAEEIRRAGCREEKIHLIPNGVEMNRFRAASAPPPRRALFAGRLEPQKGADRLPEIWKDPPAGWTLRIVGEGGLRPALEAWARGRSDVEFFPFTPNPEDHYTAASILLLPSRSEGLPNVMLEALASGLFVVASDIPATRYLADSIGEGCRLVRGDDAAAWRAALAGTVAGRIVPARNRIEVFSLERTAEAYWRLFNNGRPAPGSRVPPIS